MFKMCRFSLCAECFRTDYSRARCLLCIRIYLSMCVRVRPKSISFPAKCDFLHVYLCVSFLSAESAANSRVGTRQHLSPSVLKSFNFLPWFACAKAGNTSADERIWIYMYIVRVLMRIFARIFSTFTCCVWTDENWDWSIYDDIANIVLRIRANPAGWGKQEWQKLMCASIFLEISLSLLLFSTYYMMYNKVEENGYFWCFPSE